MMKVSHKSIRCEQLITARQEHAPVGYNVISEGDINASFSISSSLAAQVQSFRAHDMNPGISLRNGKFDVMTPGPDCIFGFGISMEGWKV